MPAIGAKQKFKLRHYPTAPHAAILGLGRVYLSTRVGLMR
jgi:hypothetical protein